jgi:predicted CoA-binding protein
MKLESRPAESNLSQLFEQARTIAVVGIKAGEREDAYRVPRYMQARGYRLVPVNPKLAEVLGEPAYASLSDLPASAPPIDIVNLFRASRHIAAHVDEILALAPRPRAVWMQLGIEDGPSAERLRAAGIEVIQNRCIMVDHQQLGAEGS